MLRDAPLRSMGPPRPGSLPERPPRGKLRTDSTYDWMEIGEQVTLASQQSQVPRSQFHMLMGSYLDAWKFII